MEKDNITSFWHSQMKGGEKTYFNFYLIYLFLSMEMVSPEMRKYQISIISSWRMKVGPFSSMIQSNAIGMKTPSYGKMISLFTFRKETDSKPEPQQRATLPLFF